MCDMAMRSCSLASNQATFQWWSAPKPHHTALPPAHDKNIRLAVDKAADAAPHHNRKPSASFRTSSHVSHAHSLRSDSLMRTPSEEPLADKKITRHKPAASSFATRVPLGTPCTRRRKARRHAVLTSDPDELLRLRERLTDVLATPQPPVPVDAVDCSPAPAEQMERTCRKECVCADGMIDLSALQGVYAILKMCKATDRHRDVDGHICSCSTLCSTHRERTRPDLDRGFLPLTKPTLTATTISLTAPMLSHPASIVHKIRVDEHESDET
eukprot:TRINITY_DN13219_c0_g1_i1.p1 TRINITY_DN13219_c0_g1~~TRINITY_DN13219_c0_g1_i1.p1  ORF type:complete len:270 (-),score=-3.71 TRINITY_DN13219_c0_g1_i1:43-852(-)